MKQRDSRFELLRIFSMFLIILSHYEFWGHSYMLNNLSGHFLKGLVVACYLTLGKTGAFLFVMITGFFIGNKNPYSIRKVISKAIYIWCYTIFYTILIAILILLLFKSVSINMKFWMQSFLPFLTDHYWFIDAYIVLMLMVPFVNIIIANVNKKTLIYYIILTAILGNAFTAFGNMSYTFTSSVGYILPSYLFGSYIRLYGIKLRNVWFKALLLYLIDIVCAALLYKFAAGVGVNNFYAGIFQFSIAGLIFIGTVHVDSFHSHTINAMASTVFADYLITENNFLRSTIWNFFSFNNVKSLFKINLIGIPVVLLILVCGFIIDHGRIYLFKKMGLHKVIDHLIIK